jgi:EmrB/QacA subfamily drug resistance transporter
MSTTQTDQAVRGSTAALVVLAVAQFVMVLDQAVMNVSITQLVEDFDTDVTTIQAVIAIYSLTMAAFMITGAKVGDRIGRKRAFTIGLVIYGCGSALTAAAWSVPVLLLGWSILEGVGAALVLPALVALISGNFDGPKRRTAFGVIGGVAGAGIAVGPILGGWATTELSWRVVFLGEVVLVAGILVGSRFLADATSEGRRPHVDVVGAALSASGLAIAVLAILQAPTWGWVVPKDSPVEPFGFSLTLFVLAAGLALLAAFVRWQRHRTTTGKDPLVDLSLFSVAPVRSGLSTFTAQNLILMGVFFVLPLYLQLVQGLDALESGIKLLPVSVAMLLASSAGPKLAEHLPVRRIVRLGLGLLVVGALILLGTIDPVLTGTSFAIGLTVLGVGMGLIASQLGNVIQSSVGVSKRGEAGGLQFTAQQLGSSLGVALIGGIVLSGLATNVASLVATDERVTPEVQEQVIGAVEDGVDFVASEDIEQQIVDAGIDDGQTKALVEDYEDAQLFALKTGLLAAALAAVAAFAGTGNLPSKKPDPDDPDAEPNTVLATKPAP